MRKLAIVEFTRFTYFPINTFQLTEDPTAAEVEFIQHIKIRRHTKTWYSQMEQHHDICSVEEMHNKTRSYLRENLKDVDTFILTSKTDKDILANYIDLTDCNIWIFEE